MAVAIHVVLDLQRGCELFTALLLPDNWVQHGAEPGVAVLGVTGDVQLLLGCSEVRQPGQWGRAGELWCHKITSTTGWGTPGRAQSRGSSPWNQARVLAP